MEGNDRPRRDPEPQAPLREWQKNTWYGPAPVNENPFDEPEDAPELRELRSENLNNRSGAFWDSGAQSRITGGYRFGNPAPEQTVRPDPGAEKREDRKKRHPWLTLLAGLAAAAGVWLLLYHAVFIVSDIQVTGNSEIPASEIIRLSEIRTGMPLLSIRDADVENRLRTNPKLKFRYLQKELPGTVILSVKEREACCWMTWNGIVYTMDKQRVVLSESEDIRQLPDHLVRVDGLQIRSGAMEGQTLVLESEAQERVFSSLFLEMRVLNCTDLIAEADLSNYSSLLLTTRDGFTVAMGDSKDIHAKLRAMLITRDELIRRGYRGGIINVILPETPVFSPPSV